MCGIAGIISTKKNTIQQQKILAMQQALLHRGPNGSGTYLNEKNSIGLAHTRLSILDLSEAAAQPLHYLGKYTIIHNGEIYNYIELKKTLEQKGYSFKTTSDTEVIVAAFDCFGVECLQQFDGMFAFAIWNEEKQELFIAKDRFGEKQLYFFVDGTHTIYFANEMKALWSVGVPKEINHNLVCLYLGTGFTSLPLAPDVTFYKSIQSLPVANYAFITIQNNELLTSINTYWDVYKNEQIEINETEATELFYEKLQNSITKRLRSDVPIGTSLSGGLDSSSIAGILHSQQVKNYKTFSATFPNFALDETKYINTVVKQFDLQNTQVQPTATDFENDFEKLITTQEQPFISSSVYAQYKVMQLAKEHNIKVLLDGQGADETIGGYTKYIKWYLQELFLYDKKRFNEEAKLYDEHFGIRNKMAAWFPAAASTRLQRKATNVLLYKSSLNENYVASNFSRLFIYKPFVKNLNDILYYSTMQFGLDELLRYADKNSMAHGVEVRLPFLQHKLVQFIFSLPAHLKIKQGYQKYILRKAMEPTLPKEITWRKNKIGYETPQAVWLESSKTKQRIEAAMQNLISKGILDKKTSTRNTSTELQWRWLIANAYL